MSHTEHFKGKANKVIIEDGQTVLDKAESILKDRNKEIASYYSNAIECLCSEFHHEFFYHPKRKSLFSLVCNEVDEEDDIIKATKISEDVYEFELRYYNGGASFDECLEQAFDEIE